MTSYHETVAATPPEVVGIHVPIGLLKSEVRDPTYGVPGEARVFVADTIRSQLAARGINLDQVVFSGFIEGGTKFEGDFDNDAERIRNLRLLAEEAENLMDAGVHIDDPDRFAAHIAEIKALQQARPEIAGTHQYYFAEDTQLDTDQYNPINYAATVAPVVGVYSRQALLENGREVHEEQTVWCISGTEEDIESALILLFKPEYTIIDG
ncbi:hypothetical protein KC973_00595 [Candidatus Saccharibacteria bacterium]|nr:hypothetical protein [Candidatus Saccharibacteria bacterium]